jgi:hypothetical protein
MHAGDHGFGTPNGAAQVQIEDIDCGGSNACAFISQCLNLSGPLSSPQLFGGGAFKALDHSEDLLISHFFYPEAGCAGDSLGQTGVAAPVSQVGVWQRFTGGFAAPAGSASVAVFVGVNDGTPADGFLIDSLYLAPPGDVESLSRHGSTESPRAVLDAVEGCDEKKSGNRSSSPPWRSASLVSRLDKQAGE